MLGELNASHLGISGNIRSPEEVTADLGLLFDEGYKGPGLKIAEILKRGPADRRGLDLKVGDMILGDRSNRVDRQGKLEPALERQGERECAARGDEQARPIRRRSAQSRNASMRAAVAFRSSCTSAGCRRTPTRSPR